MGASVCQKTCADLLSEAMREQYVYDQLRLSTNLWQNVLNQAERDNAFLNILLKNGTLCQFRCVASRKPIRLAASPARSSPCRILLREVR